MFNLGLSEIILISIIALIFIGPKQLPEIARTIGRALNELKRASEDLTSSFTNPRSYDNRSDLLNPQSRSLAPLAEEPTEPMQKPKVSDSSEVTASTDGDQSPIKGDSNS